MCHAVRVKLSPAEAKTARKLTGVMVPVYACLALIALAAIALSPAPRPGDTLVAHNSTPQHSAAGKAAD